MAIRILHVVTYMGRGGLETMIMNYYRQMDRTKVQFDFLVHRDFRADYTVKCSARTGEGLEELKDVLAKLLAESQIYLEELYTYKEAGKIQIIREYGSLLSEEYREDGIFVKARVPAEIFVSVMPKSHK